MKPRDQTTMQSRFYIGCSSILEWHALSLEQCWRPRDFRRGSGLGITETGRVCVKKVLAPAIYHVRILAAWVFLQHICKAERRRLDTGS